LRADPTPNDPLDKAPPQQLRRRGTFDTLE
jgi:hypothetical protein